MQHIVYSLSSGGYRLAAISFPDLEISSDTRVQAYLSLWVTSHAGVNTNKYLEVLVICQMSQLFRECLHLLLKLSSFFSDIFHLQDSLSQIVL